jgi:hypothetical protein
MPLSHPKTYMPLIIKLKPSTLRNRRPFEEREIKVLSSQMRQSVIEEVHGNIKALSILKKQGKRVELSLPLQYGSIEAVRHNLPNYREQAVCAGV